MWNKSKEGVKVTLKVLLSRWERLKRGVSRRRIKSSSVRCSVGYPKFGAEVQVADAQLEVIGEGSHQIALEAIRLNGITFSACLHASE